MLSRPDWPEGSIPQVAEPFTRNGHHYLLEVDEFADYSAGTGPDQARAPVGAARIIDIDDPRQPKVVSHIRLAVHQPGARAGDQQLDPGAQHPGPGVRRPLLLAADAQEPEHRRLLDDPLRPADLRHPRRAQPTEVGYFNRPVARGDNPLIPTALGAFAMSQPAWDAARRSVWYTDGNKGFYVSR